MKGLKEVSILWLCGVKQRFYLTSTNRPVLWIKSKVSSSILLLMSRERFLSPYSKSCTRTLLERLSRWNWFPCVQGSKIIQNLIEQSKASAPSTEI